MLSSNGRKRIRAGDKSVIELILIYLNKMQRREKKMRTKKSIKEQNPRKIPKQKGRELIKMSVKYKFLP